VVNGGRREESRDSRKGVSNAFCSLLHQGMQPRCDTLRKKVQTRWAVTDKDARSVKTSRLHQYGLVPTIPILICALKGMSFLFSPI
jgi:hypothetical protein